MSIRVCAAIGLGSALLFVSGCKNQGGREMELRLSPDRAARTVDVECRKSSSGKCFVAFSPQDSGALATTVGIATGEQLTVQGIGPNSRYCAATQPKRLAGCKQSTVPAEVATVRYSEQSTGE